MAEDTESKPGGKKIFLVVVLVVGLFVGGGAGAFVAGPLLAEKLGAPAAAAGQPATEHKEEAPAEEAHGAAKSEGAGGGVYLLENLVLNPAESGGTRFLMMSVAIDVKDAAVNEEMKARDAEVRDAVLGVVGRKTVEQLASVAARDSLKAEIRGSVGSLFGKGAVRRVYLPQFVIQ